MGKKHQHAARGVVAGGSGTGDLCGHDHDDHLHGRRHEKIIS
jgi:hypothetical protein